MANVKKYDKVKKWSKSSFGDSPTGGSTSIQQSVSSQQVATLAEELSTSPHN